MKIYTLIWFVSVELMKKTCVRLLMSTQTFQLVLQCFNWKLLVTSAIYCHSPCQQQIGLSFVNIYFFKNRTIKREQREYCAGCCFVTSIGSQLVPCLNYMIRGLVVRGGQNQFDASIPNEGKQSLKILLSDRALAFSIHFI